MKNKHIVFLAILTMISGTSSAQAQSLPSWRDGNITRYWADPSDIVFQLSIAGPCGSDLYHIQRSNTNFAEFAAVMLTGAASHHPVSVLVGQCAGDRNILLQGSSAF